MGLAKLRRAFETRIVPRATYDGDVDVVCAQSSLCTKEVCVASPLALQRREKPKARLEIGLGPEVPSMGLLGGVELVASGAKQQVVKSGKVLKLDAVLIADAHHLRQVCDFLLERSKFELRMPPTGCLQPP